MLATSLTKRMPFLLDNLKAIDERDFPFDKKVISLDIFKDNPLCDSLKTYAEEKEWILDAHPRKGMYKNIIQGMSYLKETDFVFYCEDDFKVSGFPPATIFEMPLPKPIVSLTPWLCHGYQNTKAFINHVKTQKPSVLDSSQNMVLYTQNPLLKNRWFISLVCGFFDTKIFDQMIEFVGKHHKGKNFEVALTPTFYSLSLDKTHVRMVYLKGDYQNYSEREILKTIREKHQFVEYHGDNGPAKGALGQYCI